MQFTLIGFLQKLKTRRSVQRRTASEVLLKPVISTVAVGRQQHYVTILRRVLFLIGVVIHPSLLKFNQRTCHLLRSLSKELTIIFLDNTYSKKYWMVPFDIVFLLLTMARCERPLGLSLSSTFRPRQYRAVLEQQQLARYQDLPVTRWDGYDITRQRQVISKKSFEVSLGKNL